MTVAYSKQTWTDGSAGGTPINAARLAHLEDGVGAAAVTADIATAGTPTGDALRAAYGAGAGIIGFGSLSHWKTARARVLAGTGDAKILCVGDSTTAGVGSDSSNVTWQGSPLAYPYQLAAMLNSAGLNAARGLGIPPPGDNGNWDGRWNGSSVWAVGALGWGGKACWQSGDTATALVYTDPVLADRYDVYYLTSPTAGTFTATATGGTAAPVNATVAHGIAKVTLSAASAATTNTVSITATGGAGPTYVVGIEPWLSTAHRVRVGNAGQGGSSAVGWTTDPFGVHEFSGSASIQAYAPDLTIISLGINDAGSSTATSSVTAALNTLIAAAQASGDVALLLPVPPQSSAAGAYTTYVPQYATAQRGLGLPYADTAFTLGSGDAQNARGRMWDALHPNGPGYADLAQPLARGLIVA